MILHLSDSHVVAVHFIALHRRRLVGRGVYSRPTDWLATTNRTNGWGRTRREALADLKHLLESAPPSTIKPIEDLL
jgi:hypothetical protein